MSARDATDSIEQLLLSLGQLEQGYLKGKKDDLAFLREMLTTPEFKSLIQAHEAVTEGTREDFSHPVSPSAVTLANMVSYDAEIGRSKEERELHHLLTSPDVSALLTAHDKVANKEYPLHSVSGETEEGSGLQPIRVVHVEKKKNPLGATVRCDEEKRIVISRVLAGSVAARSGVLQAGDVVHEINDNPITGWSIDQVAEYMQTLAGTVKFKISPAIDKFTAKKKNRNTFYIRSLMSYRPSEDRNHPCQEAGLSLEVGEVLRVVDQQDPEWWQAVKEGAGQRGVGLIPSKKYMEWIRTYSATKKKKSTSNKPKSYTTYESELLGKELATYEEMIKVEPQRGRPRPIMLIAPRNGPFTIEALKQKLISGDTAEQFGSPIPHTSRAPRSGEVNGRQFYFIRRSQMERDIMNGEMVEHAVVGGHYYGTSLNSIRRIISTGKTCLLVMDPQAIKLVRTAEIRPFIVYFTTPTAEFMKNHWVPAKKVKDTAVLDIVRQATHLEHSYSHYFDHYIPFEDIDSAYKDIVSLATNLRTNQQWVPSAWAKKQ